MKRPPIKLGTCKGGGLNKINVLKEHTVIKTHNILKHTLWTRCHAGSPKEESRVLPAPTAAARHGPYSLMFSPKGVSVLSFAIHLCSAAFLCLSDQHAFISSPVMNNEVMGCVWKCSTSLVLDVPMCMLYKCCLSRVSIVCFVSPTYMMWHSEHVMA